MFTTKKHLSTLDLDLWLGSRYRCRRDNRLVGCEIWSGPGYRGACPGRCPWNVERKKWPFSTIHVLRKFWAMSTLDQQTRIDQKSGLPGCLQGSSLRNLPVNGPPATVSESKPNGQSEPPRLWPSFTDPLEVFLNSTLKIGDFPFPTSHFQQFMGTCSPVPH